MIYSNKKRLIQCVLR